MWGLRYIFCSFVFFAISDKTLGTGPDDQRIYFSDEMDTPQGRNQSPSTQSQIPLDMLMRLNSVTNTSQLFSEFITEPPVLLGYSRLGSGSLGSLAVRGAPAHYEYEVDVERKAASVPKPALCMPELQTVKLKSSDDPSIFYFPSCTRIEQCGGCCSHELLSCQPVNTEPIAYQVLVTQFSGRNQLEYKGKEVVIVQKHTKCKCDCKIKETDCNQFQVYVKTECKCNCANTEKQKKCENESSIKLWDPQSCSCKCREVQECSTGLLWDHLQCSCVPVPRTKQKIGQDPQDRTRYRFGPGDRV